MMSICTAPTYELKELNNLFIELTAKNCNQRCSSCYIDFPISKKVKDFIPIDAIKTALVDTKNENLYCIYLTGGEPMTHPDFNSILRLCLKRCNVCICTNGSFLNEKKIRFLKKVEEEGNTQIFFQLSLAHFNELESDKVKYRGHYRQVISALKILNRYGFNSVLSIQNFYKLSEVVLKENFIQIFKQNEIEDVNIQVNVSYPDNIEFDSVDMAEKTDCMYGRVLTKNGIYACPFLSNDYRGRMGLSFSNYSKTITAETNYCQICCTNNKPIFSVQ